MCWCFFARARTFQRVHSLESYSRTSGGSNDHRQCRDTNCTTRTILSVCWCKSPVFSKHTTLTHSSHSSLSHSFREKLVVGLFGLSFSFSFGQFPLFRCVQFLATLLELLDSLRRLWAAKPAHMDRICFFRSRWHPAGPLGGWVEVILDFLDCDDAMHCRYGAEMKTLGKHLNSSASYFPTWCAVTMHVWEFSFQLRPQAGQWHNVCSLCMLWQDFSPLQPGTVFMSAQWWTWWVTDFGWSPTLPYVTVLATATQLLPRKGGGTMQFGCQQYAPDPHSVHGKTQFGFNRTPEQELVRGLWEARMPWCTADAFL